MNNQDEVQEESLNLYNSEIQDLDAEISGVRSILYSGQDFDIDGLVRRLIDNVIMIPSFGHTNSKIHSAGFQRSFVWRKPQMDKFIESILLGYPIPGIFLVKQEPDNTYLVLDGQQRLQTLKYFCDGKFEKKEFLLQNVSDEFKGLTYKKLPQDLKNKLNNTFIQAIIVTSDGSDHTLEAIYGIFERLNSGGTQLTPHEIRVALYAGEFIEFLEKLNKLPSWRELYGKKSPRLRDQELVLRILGLHLHGKSYKKPLKGFLNTVVSKHRKCKDIVNVRDLFDNAARIFAESIGPMAFRNKKGWQINAAQAEVLMVAMMNKLATDADFNPSSKSIERQVNKLKSNQEFLDTISTSTADEQKVKTRLSLANDAFKDL